MCKLLMSINPQHVNNILAGTKRFEYRKTKCKEDVDSIIIYSTSPVMQIVAEVEVTEIIQDSPQTVWKKTSSASGIEHHRQLLEAFVLGIFHFVFLLDVGFEI